MNNKLNLNNVQNNYNHSIKKDETKVVPKISEKNKEITNNGTQAAESYGRILVKQADKIDNAEMIKSVKDSIEFFVQNPKLAAAAVKASDDAFDILCADESANAYEEACCGVIDAAYNRQ